ncbi:Crp/Fnr family transcriptional regulator [Neoroseomonas nitratireducens]|nr:Crp/Fnr family transcriptional regulator [Neoroseomonas nitratireducens]
MTAEKGSVGDTAAPEREMSRLDRLRRLPILREAGEAALTRAAEAASWRSYGPGGLILDLDDATGDVWFVLEGTVRIQVRTPSGRELILTDIQAGGFFGEIAAVDGAPRTAGATALTRARLCAVPAAAFMDAACSTPAACRALLRHVTEILRRQAKRLLEREALPVRLRVHAELLRLSRPRIGRDGAQDGEQRIVTPPPRQHILAARIGTRREAVSREFAELMRQGIIARERGGIVILQPEALRRSLEAELEAETDL